MNIVTLPAIIEKITKDNNLSATEHGNGVTFRSKIHLNVRHGTIITPSCDDVPKRFEISLLSYVKTHHHTPRPCLVFH